MTAKRRTGCEARGSSRRARWPSRVVTDKNTTAALSPAKDLEYVDIACDDRALRDDHHRVAKLRQHLEAAPRQVETTLDGLVGVCNAAHSQHLGLQRPRMRQE
jgi:hypothetical protein